MRLLFTSCIALAAAVAKVNAGCWANSQGFQCCDNPSSTKVEYTDSSGQWGVQNGQWCGIDYSYATASQATEQCTGGGLYPCCQTCQATYTDSDGKWAIENGNWCGIKNSCNSSQGSQQCTGGGAQYPCCQGCQVSYTDSDGKWGYENGNWCGIKNSCNTSSSSNNNNNGSSNNNNNNNNNSSSSGGQQQSTTSGRGSAPANPPDFSGQSGKTTRYWDCCLASCSWSENTKNDGCKGTVRSCEKDGVTAYTDLANLWQAKSGCEGGRVYMCHDQQPWAVNDKVAYGFVASHEKCCTCQRLKFVDGPVAGKQMLVQTTNTGGDLGTNHFDIQMPGGGFGIFDGCTSQFGGSYNWGERYGGIKSASECSNLPPELSEGCKWRFDWFMNADNPNVVFERIKCPKELTDITGCIPNDDDQQKEPW